MPKISAATVAEHRARQREALIEAAVDILVAEGATAVTPAAVGARAGLARSSVYQYFDSAAALLATIVEEAFPRANAALAEALAGADGPAARIDAYIATMIRLGAEGAHRPAAALMASDLHPACRERLMELHHEQAAPLRDAVRDLGVPDPGLTADLLGGLLHGALTAADRGAPADTVLARTLSLVHEGLAGAGPHRPHTGGTDNAAR
ncbi:TetR/AcrR family transcriptional regulator [Streptomyces sp. F63]|uniref:TetR/AcrR family transcriptional regulator n=1 Tax=Streptomyces sp. F63 TaxID=2824887 RepID=UPI001B3679AE|nr:TetR/AcrR family transcriptional regulator [Streptomyces sp. F63]MBQ0986721.1 TetR/AcrR family transcriptional regulator [Streptomyces sp. F63]